MKRAQTSASRRSVASRTLAAVLGGYVLANATTLAVPLLLGVLGVSRSQAWMAATMASFLLYAAIVMAVFHARSAVRAWSWLVGAALPLCIVVWFLLPHARA